MQNPSMPFQSARLPAHLAQWTQASGITVSLATFELSEDCLASLIVHSGTLPGHLDRAVLKRRVEYLAGRRCAATALGAHAGRECAAPAMGDDRLPVWPGALHGSISHGGGLAAAIVGLKHRYLGLGIDVEAPIAPLRCQRLGPRVANDREFALLHALDTSTAARFTAIFSAKEALFKALYPGVRRYFDFLDAELTACDAARGVFRIELIRDLSAQMPAGRAFELRHGVTESGHVISLCAVAHRGG